jgi:mannose-1-phosphate guanylyltransferase
MGVLNEWALVLAGGDGERLRALTTAPCGTPVPKQYCSLHGKRLLVEDAIERGLGLVPRSRVCAIVADGHRQWWSQAEGLQALPGGNVVVQPSNRGTGVGVLYAILHILAKDPLARIILFPADHYVADERSLRRTARVALANLAGGGARPVLMGLKPTELDPDLGYIVPGSHEVGGTRSVRRFIEKPSIAMARQLIDDGALWNAFIIAANARSLLRLFARRHLTLAREMEFIVNRALSAEAEVGWTMIVDMYQRLPTLDFSRDVLQDQASFLCVVEAPSCGWSDLGTPARVGEALRRARALQPSRDLTSNQHISLAVAHARLERQTAPTLQT